MRLDILIHCCLPLLVSLITNGCGSTLSSDVVNIPTDVESNSDLEQRDVRGDRLFEFGYQIEESINARLLSIHENPSIVFDGATASYGDESNILYIFLSIISTTTSSYVDSVIQETVLQAIKEEGIPRADVGLKNDETSSFLRTFVIENSEREKPEKGSADALSQ